MTQITRRALVAAAGTLAVTVPLRKPRAQALAGVDALQVLPAPKPVDIHFTTADGGTRSVADYVGHGVVLNLWATWCVPCVREMPALDDMARVLAHDGVVVLPLSSDHAGAAVVQKFYAEHSITTLPVLLDPRGAAAAALGVSGIPTTLIIDAKGREVAWLEGSADWSQPDMMAAVRRLAGKTTGNKPVTTKA